MDKNGKGREGEGGDRLAVFLFLRFAPEKGGGKVGHPNPGGEKGFLLNACAFEEGRKGKGKKKEVWTVSLEREGRDEMRSSSFVFRLLACGYSGRPRERGRGGKKKGGEGTKVGKTPYIEEKRRRRRIDVRSHQWRLSHRSLSDAEILIEGGKKKERKKRGVGEGGRANSQRGGGKKERREQTSREEVFPLHYARRGPCHRRKGKKRTMQRGEIQTCRIYSSVGKGEKKKRKRKERGGGYSIVEERKVAPLSAPLPLSGGEARLEERQEKKKKEGRTVAGARITERREPALFRSSSGCASRGKRGKGEENPRQTDQGEGGRRRMSGRRYKSVVADPEGRRKEKGRNRSWGGKEGGRKTAPSTCGPA